VAAQAFALGGGVGNTYPELYDTLGRYFFAGVSLSF
jgi:hypothetical protein